MRTRYKQATHHASNYQWWFVSGGRELKPKEL